MLADKDEWDEIHLAIENEKEARRNCTPQKGKEDSESGDEIASHIRHVHLIINFALSLFFDHKSFDIVFIVVCPLFFRIGEKAK